jgi:hypothetical protein
MKRNSRPFLATTVLRQLSPRKTLGTSFFAPNPYAVLREPSPVPSVCSDAEFRSRAGSVKRKNNEDTGTSYANVVSASDTRTATGPVIVIPDPLVDKVNVDVVKVNSLMDKVSTDLGKVEIPPEVACIFNDLREAVCIIAKNQVEIVNKLGSGTPGNNNVIAKTNVKEGVNMVSLGNIAKKQRYDLGPKLLPETVDRSREWIPAAPARTAPGRNPDPEPGTELDADPKLTKFREVVRDAERSTLVFNLDMGKVPIMNRETISKKATLSLTSMAAKKEQKTTSIPSDDAVAAIDDVLSITTGMEFFGAQTKTYKHPSDPNSGLYCTVPVKYEFENKEDRIRAEMVLRDRCDVHCTTPYPPLLRECIKQIIGKVKQEHPNNLVRVVVDTKTLAFKASYRASKKGDEKSSWTPYRQSIPIPESAMDVYARRVPEGFSIAWPETKSPRKNSNSNTETSSNTEMEVTETTPAP